MASPTDPSLPAGFPDIRPPERLVRGQWAMNAQAARDAGGELLALWGSDDRDRASAYTVRAAFRHIGYVGVFELAVPEDAPSFPSIAAIFPAAARAERAIGDLLGLACDGSDTRRWLRHAAWAEDRFPLRRDFDTLQRDAPGVDRYPFVRVEGEGVHEIAVGPVHAGTIEPGHFRFSVVGEKVLRLEQRLGYTHKGIERGFIGLSVADGRRLAARVSGDSTVAYGWAYCMAVERLCGVAPPPRASSLRALLLERERLANHLGDLGALGNDAGLAFGLAQFSRLKEDVLRLNATLFGARYPMDVVVPGGVARDFPSDGIAPMLEQCGALETALQTLRGIYDEHAGLQDRFVGAGRVDPALAVRLGLTGLAARASGLAHDLRCDLPVAPYDRLGVRLVCFDDGDVAARVAVRFEEALESLRLCRALLQDLPAGATSSDLPAPTAHSLGLGLVEGWRGPVLVALEMEADGRIRRCHPRDPSWSNWPVLEHAIIGNIVPDFPLINKSFNLSYSGHDL